MRNRLGVVIITKNEAKNIGRCLESIKWADEIIVLDSGSTDQTIKIAKSHGAIVYHQAWLGFGPQKNKALEYSTCDWILSLDADEVVTAELALEIQTAIIHNKQSSIYTIQRRNFFCGQPLKYVWGNDWVIRLFKKGTACFTNDLIHESVQSTEKIKPSQLKNLIYHYSVDDFTQYLNTMNHYTTLAAGRDFERGKRASLWTVCYKTLFMLIKSCIFKAGFLDGRMGMIVSILNAQSKFYQYLKLRQLSRENKHG